MSVPVNQRTQGKLEACTKALNLAKYTLQITANKNIFTVAYQDALTNKIIDAVLNIYMTVRSANQIQVNSQEDYENRKRKFITRQEKQKEAILECDELDGLILLAKPIFHLSSKRIKYWSGLVSETRRLVKAWSESDRKRFES